jgi:hypothetical protein
VPGLWLQPPAALLENEPVVGFEGRADLGPHRVNDRATEVRIYLYQGRAPTTLTGGGIFTGAESAGQYKRATSIPRVFLLEDNWLFCRRSVPGVEWATQYGARRKVTMAENRRRRTDTGSGKDHRVSEAEFGSALKAAKPDLWSGWPWQLTEAS